MKLFGIDYGKHKIGIAVADMDSKLAEPVSVVRVESINEAVKKTVGVIGTSEIECVVVGVSAGEMAKESKEFGKLLEDVLDTPVIFQDENFSTQEAQALAIEAGIKRSKRKRLEDAYSATLILQEYLDEEMV